MKPAFKISQTCEDLVQCVPGKNAETSQEKYRHILGIGRRKALVINSADDFRQSFSEKKAVGEAPKCRKNMRILKWWGEKYRRNTVRSGSRVEKPNAVGDTELIRCPSAHLCHLFSVLPECRGNTQRAVGLHTWIGYKPEDVKEENRQRRVWNVKYGL